MNKFLNFIKFIPNFPIFSVSNEKKPARFYVSGQAVLHSMWFRGSTVFPLCFNSKNTFTPSTE